MRFKRREIMRLQSNNIHVDQAAMSFRQHSNHSEHRRQGNQMPDGRGDYVRQESLSPSRGECSRRQVGNTRAPTKHRGRRRSAGPAVGRRRVPSPPPYSELPTYDQLEHSPERSPRCSSGVTSHTSSNTETLL